MRRNIERPGMSDRDERRNLIDILRSDHRDPQNAVFETDKNFQTGIKRYLESKLPAQLLKQRAPGHGATVIRDRFGVPHIFAENPDDLWFASGYVQAQDRLWQIDNRRRVATGTLAEVVGSEALHRDLESRTIGFERAARLEFADIDDRAGSALEAYARGVNAWTNVAIDNLPVEFEVLGYEPGEWSPIATLAVLREFWWSLTGRLHQIVGAERVLRDAPPDVADRFLTPEVTEYIVPGHLDSDGSVPDGGGGEGGGDDGTGSNNWVVGPSRSRTGLPLLASDPHWPIHFPDLWYDQHLIGPGVDCIGAAYAGVGPIVFGRTREAAWARTNNVSSVRDLYHERLDPDGSSRYIDGTTSVPFEIIEETVHVRGGEVSNLKIQLTRRGPIVNQFIPPIDSGGDGPVSLKWVGHERIGDFSSLLALNRARSADEIKLALSGWRLSVWNAVYADDAGNFGYQMSGAVPRRGRMTRGTRDASGVEDQWDGYTGTDLLPGLRNPDRGWVASANNTPAPVSLLGEITGAYADGYRFRRIGQVLGKGDRMTPAGVRSLQWDNFDQRASELKGYLADLLQSAGETDCLLAAGALTSWDCRFEGDNAGPAVWTALWSRLSKAVNGAVLGAPAAELMAESAGAVVRSLLLGEENPRDYGLDLLDLAKTAASDALSYLRQALGPDISDWGWNRAHHVSLDHPAARTGAMKKLMNRGPFSCPGGGGVVNNRRPIETPQGFVNASGVSYRLFVDMSEPGRAWAASLAGQSGQPGSDHYDDRVQETLRNEYHPLLMDRAEIEREAVHEFIAPADDSRQDHRHSLICEPTLGGGE